MTLLTIDNLDKADPWVPTIGSTKAVLSEYGLVVE
jgi:hypothetical protein